MTPGQRGTSELSEDLFLFFNSTKMEIYSHSKKEKNITEGYKIKSKRLLSEISYFLEISLLTLFYFW